MRYGALDTDVCSGPKVTVPTLIPRYKAASQVTVPTLIPRYKAASQIPSLQKNSIPKNFPPNKPVEQKSKMTARIFGKGEQKTVKGNAENSFSKMREEKKLGESRKENIPTKQNPVETTSILNSECSDIILNCDISCIKPTNKSFAPENFMFLPPAGVCSFNAFENLPTVIYEKRKLKGIVRTSTPRKQTDEVVENKPSNIASGNITVNEDRKDDTSELLKDIPCSDITESEIYITEILHSEETVTSKGMTENENVTEIGKYNAMAEQNSISVENVVPVHEELKDNAAAKRRVSLRGKMEMLDTISEGCESDSSSVKSKRKSTNLCNSLATPNRPRRSLRLAKIFEDNHSENCLGEPSGTNIKKDGHSESVHHGKLEQDFEQLHLESVEEDQAACKASGKQPLMELNVDFIDFKNEPSVGVKSRKISLLYTPEKARRSTRLSIKDDLITFSPDL